jgi:hypothetical protein
MNLLEILPLHELEDEEGLPVRLLQPVDGGDVRVIEGGEEMGLPLEAPEALGILCDLGGKTLMATSRPRFVAVAR